MDIGDTTLYAQGPLKESYAALERGDWAMARTRFQAALVNEETPAAWEGLALAAWWQNDLDAAFAARERAYPLYRERDDPRAAARVAIWLAWDYLGIRAQPAVADGWLQRAHSLLDDLAPGREHGWLALREAENAILWANDPATARRLAVRGIEIGRAIGLLDLAMLGLALEGFALVTEGDVVAGMRRLDEATAAAMGGELTNRCAIGSTCCSLIFACERVHDYARAAQWCERLQDYCARVGYIPLLGVCRSHYAGVLIWSGAWQEAESELATASHTLRVTRPGMLAEALAQLGLLRWRQGRLDEAVPLLEQVGFFPPAQLGLGGIALDLGDAETALDYARRYLRRIPVENRTEQVGGLELLARAHLAGGDLAAARKALEELRAIAAIIATDSLQAMVSCLAGLLAAAVGAHESACRDLEDAVDLFARAGAPFAGARARLALARSLLALGRRAPAERQARAALEALHELGAVREATGAENLLKEIARARATGLDRSQPLSQRETQVLALIAEGLSDQDVAARLVLSPHTVHRHVTNILTKLDASSRAAAVAYAIRENLL